MKKGFTLVEMAIVLLIIGVLIAGLLVARSMVETAKIQRLSKELLQYEAATIKFIEAYQYVPGDSPDFTPPGNSNSALGLISGLGTCAPAPNAILGNNEAHQFFAHLSQAEMLDKDYVSYSPVACGGPHDNDFNKTGDITVPYTELNSSLLGYSKSPITPSKASNVERVRIFFLVNASYVIPLEVKFGPAFVNQYGTGNCLNASFAVVPCTNSGAVYGSFYWFFSY